ncbi:MAG: N-6 DNA methylase [Candidatus Binatia bacterium]
MLDSETKARIDSARDILVGKVPDPKSQVEQITIALIYKFMDDMDRQSEELGGKVTFFAGEFKQYAWNHLLDKRLGGHERLLVYAEGIEKMNENKNIPQLFRDIFRGVFLPYRDPETLNLFLKEINGFTYDHSERLGDAYEYLLNVLGTQGDAGQFRTPRHIIDFIATVVDPQKHETVLDPACGTAGFLISAYKHILKRNTLSPDERARLMINFCGYDIAPDMGRLSRVNLYLHGFPSPVIHEYDALTSEERWDERYDVIMANPPFMSPKGGIRPHKRFSITATRSEVLFVDYIAEHLNPNGRAGIIVPEGIIFQGQTAYKKLRRMLVENYLWAVVSLPAGVFNPYSGVKTSILFLDRNLARRTDEVLFVKVANDGFDLGAQRRSINKNDLLEALRTLSAYTQAQKTQDNPMTLCVSRKRLLESIDCSLSGDRYRLATIRTTGSWPITKLTEVAFEIKSGFACGKSDKDSEGIPHLRPMNISANGQLVWEGTKYILEEEFAGKEEYLLKAGDVLFNNTNSKELVGKTCYVDRDVRGGYSNHITRIRPDTAKILPRLLAIFLHELWHRGTFINLCHKWIGQAGINNSLLSEVEFPLPPLDEQERIVAELDGYRKIIEGARQVVDNYKADIPTDPKWPIKTLNEVCVKITDGTHLRPDYQETGILFLSSKNVVGGVIDWTHVKYISTEEHAILAKRIQPQKGDVLLAKNGTTGIAAIVDRDETFDIYVSLALLRAGPGILPEYLWRAISAPTVKKQFDARLKGIGVPNLHLNEIKEVLLPIPPLELQRHIVMSLQAETKLVESNRKLIEIFETKIKAKLDEIWGTTENTGTESEPEAVPIETADIANSLM